MPEDLEPVLATGGRISIAELVTEELLLSLPIVPLHERAARVRAAHRSAPPSGRDGDAPPFAQLADLLKRK